MCEFDVDMADADLYAAASSSPRDNARTQRRLVSLEQMQNEEYAAALAQDIQTQNQDRMHAKELLLQEKEEDGLKFEPLPEEPAADADDVSTIKLLSANGSVTRRFCAQDGVAAVVKFARHAIQRPGPSPIQLFTMVRRSNVLRHMASRLQPFHHVRDDMTGQLA